MVTRPKAVVGALLPELPVLLLVRRPVLPLVARRTVLPPELPVDMARPPEARLVPIRVARCSRRWREVSRSVC